MDKASFDRAWNYFRAVNGVGLRAVALIPDDQLDAHPIPGMRSPKHLVIHIYTTVRGLMRSIVDGKVVDEEPVEAATEARIKTKDELLRYCRECWDDAAKIAGSLTDAQLSGTVTTPWGHTWNGAEAFRILYDEYWHHRGQLYCYLRALGVAPHSLYDTKNNDPEFAETHA